MKGWQGLLTLAVCLLWTAGCKSPPNNLALERELRYQEDMIFQLQDYVGTYKSYLDECRRENQRLRGDSDSNDDGKNSPGGGNSGPPGVDLSPPQIELPGESSEDFEPPSIDLPGVDRQSDAGQPATIAVAAQPQRAPVQKSVLRQPTDVDSDVALVSYQVSDPVVTQITFNTAQTGGYQSDDDAGADGLHILLEPRNAQGEIVPPAGAVSVALLDPQAATAAAARVARWHFLPEQVTLIAQEARANAGVALELPWPGERPIHHRLHLFLRMVTPEGKRLVADQEIDLGRIPSVLQASATEEIGAGGSAASRGWQPRTRPKPMLEPSKSATPIPSPAASEPIRTAASPAQPTWERAAEPVNQPAAEGANKTTAEQPKPKADNRPAGRPPQKRIRRPKWTPYR